MLSKGRHPPLLQSIYVPVLVSLLLVYVSSVAAFRSYGRKPVPPHTMHFVKHRREVTALPKTGTATMDEFIEDIWKDLHGMGGQPTTHQQHAPAYLRLHRQVLGSASCGAHLLRSD